MKALIFSHSISLLLSVHSFNPAIASPVENLQIGLGVAHIPSNFLFA